MLDQDGERASRRHQEWYVPPPEVTLGRATDIESFIREYKDYAHSLDFYGDRHRKRRPCDCRGRCNCSTALVAPPMTDSGSVIRGDATS